MPDAAKRESRYKGIDDALSAGEEPVVLRGVDAWDAVAGAEESADDSGGGPPGDARVPVLVDRYEHTVAGKVRLALADSPDLFQKGGTLVRVVLPAPEGPPAPGLRVDRPRSAPRIQAADQHFVRERISERCHLYSETVTESGTQRKHVSPPPWLTGMLSSDPGPVRELLGILPGPSLDGEGNLVNAMGYDAATGHYLACPVPGLEVPASPSRGDAVAAAKVLSKIVTDFPFRAEADRSRWLCLLLTAVCRHLIGITPFGLVTANQAGVGKSRLVKAISLVAHGSSDLTLMSWPDAGRDGENENEIRKRLANMLQGGESLVLVDNLPRGKDFGSPTLDGFLSAESYYDRKLGQNDGAIVGGRNRVLLIGTGNAVNPVGDTADRTLKVELVTDLPNPRARPASDFALPDLLGHLKANRARYLGAALTVWRAWMLAGAPQPPGDDWGSYEDFVSKAVSVVRWIGWADPIDGRARRAYAAEAEKQRLRELLTTWRPAMGPGKVRPSEIVRAIEAVGGGDEVRDFRAAVLAFGPGDGWKATPTAVALGKRLAAFGRTTVEVEGGDGETVLLRIAVDADSRRGTNVYSVEESPSPAG